MDKTGTQISESQKQYSTDISRRNGDDLLEIGNNYLESDKVIDAARYYENALKIYNIDKDVIGEGYALLGLAIIHEKLGTNEKAVEYYKLSIKKFRVSKDAEKAGKVSKLLANLLLIIGDEKAGADDYDKARKYYKESLKYYEISGDLLGEGYALTGLGTIYEKFNDFAESRTHYEKALNKFKKAKDYERAGIVSKLIASTYEAHEALEDALIDYSRSLELFKKIRDIDREKEIQKSISSIKDKRSIVRINKKQIMFLSFYLILICIAELVTTYNSMEAGLIIHVSVLVMLLIHGALEMERSYNFSYLLLSMMAVPMIRIVGLTIPIMHTPALYWFPIISIPLFAATFTIARIQKISRRNLGLTFGNIPVQLGIALSGLFLGFIEYQILQPKPLISVFSIESVLVAGFILLISTGLAEELLFRGIIQKNAENVFGNLFGLLYSSLLFTFMHIGWNSVYDWIFVFCVAMFYGYVFQRTRSLFGVTLSHGISNSVLFLIMPFFVF